MKKYIRCAVLILLLLAGLSVCATMVLGIYGRLFQMTFDHLLFSGFQVGLIASVIILTGAYLKRKKS